MLQPRRQWKDTASENVRMVAATWARDWSGPKSHDRPRFGRECSGNTTQRAVAYLRGGVSDLGVDQRRWDGQAGPGDRLSDVVEDRSDHALPRALGRRRTGSGSAVQQVATQGAAVRRWPAAKVFAVTCSFTNQGLESCRRSAKAAPARPSFLTRSAVKMSKTCWSGSGMTSGFLERRKPALGTVKGSGNVKGKAVRRNPCYTL